MPSDKKGTAPIASQLHSAGCRYHTRINCPCVVLAQQGSEGPVHQRKSDVQPSEDGALHDSLSKRLRAEAQPAWQLDAHRPEGIRHDELEVQLCTLTTDGVEAGRRPSEGPVILDVSCNLALGQCHTASERAVLAEQRPCFTRPATLTSTACDALV